MNGLNGIIVDGKVYEVVRGASCEACSFDEEPLSCSLFCCLCVPWKCAFRFSQELTDKINKK